MRAKVEYPFRIIEQQFGHMQMRYHGSKKDTAQSVTPFALSDLWMVRAKLMAAML